MPGQLPYPFDDARVVRRDDGLRDLAAELASVWPGFLDVSVLVEVDPAGCWHALVRSMSCGAVVGVDAVPLRVLLDDPRVCDRCLLPDLAPGGGVHTAALAETFSLRLAAAADASAVDRAVSALDTLVQGPSRWCPLGEFRWLCSTFLLPLLRSTGARVPSCGVSGCLVAVTLDDVRTFSVLHPVLYYRWRRVVASLVVAAGFDVWVVHAPEAFLAPGDAPWPGVVLAGPLTRPRVPRSVCDTFVVLCDDASSDPSNVFGSGTLTGLWAAAVLLDA